MKIKSILLTITILLIYFSYAFSIEIELSKKLFIKNDQVVIRSFSSVIESQDKSIFILDAQIKKIYKFSAQGAFISSFGKPGEGPGDFISPANMNISKDGKIVIGEIRKWVSFFSDKGGFIDKKALVNPNYNFINFGFIDDNLYYCENPQPDMSRSQLICDENGDVIIKDINSVKPSFITLENGAIFGRIFFEYSPFLISHMNKGYAVLANSREYKITLIGFEGKKSIVSRQNIQPPKISSNERSWFIERLKDQNNQISPKLLEKLSDQIPENKNYIEKLLVCSDSIWVSRVSEDVTKKNQLKTVDLFSLNGDYKGSFQISIFPIYLTDQSLYVIEEDSDENEQLIKYFYKIIK